MQLDLFACTDELPVELFAFSNFSWENLLASEELDNQYSVETVIRGKSHTGNWIVYLRNIEGGVWLWGVSVYCKKRQHGSGFYPFRKWGANRAAMSREAAIESALVYVEGFLQE